MRFSLLLAVTLLPAITLAQPLKPAETGPVIADFGPTYAVDAPAFATPTDGPLKVVFDVAQSPETDGVNPHIETVARFLNMHARAGLDPADLHAALVIHGAAGKDLLGDDAYRARYGTANPNTPLLDALHAAGVRIVLCGQTAMHRGLAPATLSPTVDLALSAITAHIALQAEGYATISFGG